MPCETFKNDQGQPIGIVCSRGRRKPPRCFYCPRPSERLCDYPVSRAGNRQSQTCDRPLCLDHTTQVSKQTDICPEAR